MSQNPQLPEGHWAVSEQDKVEIQKFGRALTEFIMAYAKEHGGEGRFKTKLVAGAFEYFMNLQMAKARLINDDILIAQDAMIRYELADQIVEPFSPTPVNEPEDMSSDLDIPSDTVKETAEEVVVAEENAASIETPVEVQEDVLASELSEPTTAEGEIGSVGVQG